MKFSIERVDEAWISGCALYNEVAEELRRIRHSPIDEQGSWLASLLRGYYAYFAVPTNLPSVRAVRHQVKIRWFLNLKRLINDYVHAPPFQSALAHEQLNSERLYSCSNLSSTR
jgi:hypothetical protein